MAKVTSDSCGEAVSVWMGRFDSFKDLWQQDEDERGLYRDAWEGDYGELLPGAVSYRDTLKPGGLVQPVLNLLEGYGRRLQAKIGDEYPQLRYPRERIGRITLGDIDLAERFVSGVESMLCEVTETGGLPDEFRDAIPNLCTDGSVGIAVTMPLMPDQEEVGAARESAADQIERAATEGEVEPSRYQDSESIAATAAEAAAATVDPSDPSSPQVSEVSPETTDAAWAVAEAHAKAADEQAKALQFREKGSIEFCRVPVEQGVLWDSQATDPRRWRWQAQRVVMTKGEARELPSLADGWVDSLPTYRYEDEEDGSSRFDRYVPAQGESDDSALIEFFVVQDGRHRTRHFIARGSEEYGERNEADPYVDPGGRPMLPGYFTVEVVAPYRVARNVPRRTLGVPLFRAGYDQQCGLIKCDAAIQALVMRAARDIYGAHAEVAPNLRKAIASAEPGAVVDLPAGVNAREAMAAFEFKGPIAELLQERQQKLVDVSVAMKFPLAEMTSQPVADTAAQEDIARQGGENATSDIQQRLELGYGRCVDRAWALIVATWSDEAFWSYFPVEVSGMLQQLPGFNWRATVLNDLRIRAKFSPAQQDRDPVRVEQLMGLLPLASAAGVKPMAILRALFRAADLGEPEVAPMMPVGPEGEPPEGGDEAGGPPRRPANRRGRGGRRAGPPQRGNMMGAARNVGMGPG